MTGRLPAQTLVEGILRVILVLLVLVLLGLATDAIFRIHPYPPFRSMGPEVLTHVIRPSTSSSTVRMPTPGIHSILHDSGSCSGSLCSSAPKGFSRCWLDWFSSLSLFCCHARSDDLRGSMASGTHSIR